MRVLLWLGLLFLLLIACLLQPSVVLYACLGCWLALPLLSWALLWPSRRRVCLQMEAPAVTQKGRSAALHIACCFPTRVTGILCVENSVTGEISRRRLVLNGEQTVLLESDYCGCLRCSVEKLRLWDLCGLLPIPVPSTLTKRILVMPDTFPVTISMETAPAQSEDCQEYAQDRRGQDRTETWQLRDYVPGDSLRQIHWKLSSKRTQLVVREPACPVDRSLLLFVDRTWGETTPQQADAIMEAAVSIAQALTEQGQPFRLCWNGETIQSRNVKNDVDLPEAVAALLCSRRTAGVSGSDLYLRTCGVPQEGRIIYLGTQAPEDAFSQGARCKVLLRDFSPEVLRNLSWS